MRRLALVLFGLSACGGAPLLHGLPQPNPAVVAGIAAVTAGVATIANPSAAGRPTEKDHADEGDRSDGKREQVPLEVLDRADAERPQP